MLLRELDSTEALVLGARSVACYAEKALPDFGGGISQVRVKDLQPTCSVSVSGRCWIKFMGIQMLCKRAEQGHSWR